MSWTDTPLDETLDMSEHTKRRVRQLAKKLATELVIATKITKGKKDNY